MDIKEIIEKQIQTWYNEDTDKRCVIVIAAEDRGNNKTALSMSVMGKYGNLKMAVAQAVNSDEHFPKILDDAVKIALVEKIMSDIKGKEEEKK